MNREQLETRKAELSAELDRLQATAFRIQGALVMIEELLTADDAEPKGDSNDD